VGVTPLKYSWGPLSSEALVSRIIFAAALFVIAVLPAAGWAQYAAVIGGPRAPDFRALQDSQWVRFTGSGVSRRQGMILEHDGLELVVSAEREPLRIQATSIDTLWTRGNSAKQGAIIGSIAGALAGVALGLQYGATTTEHDFSTGQAVLLLGGIGAAGGGLLGTLFGLGLPRWTRRFP
jgi:hypothetical protein